MDPASATWPAPAKLNLFLHVTGRRDDGYHDLQTLFQLLDWGDEVCVHADRTGVIRRAGQDYGVPEKQDLAIRAKELLKRETGVSGNPGSQTNPDGVRAGGWEL